MGGFFILKRFFGRTKNHSIKAERRNIMEQIYGAYHRKISATSGKHEFILYKMRKTPFEPDSPYVRCRGNVGIEIKHVPIELSGHYDAKRAIFIVEDYEIKTLQQNDIEYFLKKINLPKLGNAKIKLIAENVKDKNIFSQENNKQALKESLLSKVDEEILENISSYIEKVLNADAVYKKIEQYGGTLKNTNNILNKYGTSTLDIISKNPYVLLYTANMSFTQCDQIAKKNGMEACDKKRIKALVEYILKRNEANGNSRISYDNLCNNVQWFEKDSCYKTDEIFIAAELLNEYAYRVVEEDNDIYVYRRDTYMNEVTIAKKIKQLNAPLPPNRERQMSIEKLEQLCGIVYADKQREAIKLSDTNGVKIITGGPGTGKTTTLNGLLRKYEYEHPNSKVLLCAPTGCAAKRMEEATGRQASTIHKALDIRPYMEEEFIAMTDILDYDCIVVDEFSMAGEFIVSLLLKSIRVGTLVILIGDKDQLPSVDYGNVLSDLIQSGIVDVVELNVNYRQGKANSILENAQKINEGRCYLRQDNKTIIRNHNSEAALIEDAIETYVSLFDPKDKNAVKLFTTTKKKYDAGSVSINNKIKEKINGNSNNSFWANGYEFSENDIIIMNRNNYKKGYLNGDTGYIDKIEIKGFDKKVSVIIDDEEIVLTNQDLQDMELGYAITTHKSQGTECKKAIILLPKQPKGMLLRQLVYVAVTRAKEQNYIMTEQNSLQYAIKNVLSKKRQTGLLWKLMQGVA